MLSTSSLGRAIRNAVIENEFSRIAQTNELMHMPSQTCYGHTTTGRIYRRQEATLQVLDAPSQQFSTIRRLPAGEAPDRARYFGPEQLVPGLMAEQDAFVARAEQLVPATQGCDPHHSTQAYTYWQRTLRQDLQALTDVIQAWRPHPDEPRG